MANSKELTAPTPHKVIKEMSLFLGKFEPQADNAGWAFTKDLYASNGYITVSSRNKPTARDGRVFDYVMSSLFAQRRHLFEGEKGKLKKDFDEVDITKAYEEIEIDIRDVLKSRDMTLDSKNKSSVIKSLKNLVDMTIEMKNENAVLVYSLLTSVRCDDINSNVLYVKVNDEINNAFYAAGMRFINIERVMLIRSNIEIEFCKFLQVRGQGINKSTGVSHTPNVFKHDDAVHYLHLEHLGEKEQINAIRRAIKSAVKAGYDNYRMKRTMSYTKWEKVS